LNLSIEDDVMISWGCSIMDRDFHAIAGDVERLAPTIIGKHAWIGCQSIILKGVRIGQGAVIGAGSVVTRDVPDFAIAAGNPARIVKQNQAR
jgi:acetyltransferase-like isoleucine patch superfamily enzyme